MEPRTWRTQAKNIPIPPTWLTRNGSRLNPCFQTPEHTNGANTAVSEATTALIFSKKIISQLGNPGVSGWFAPVRFLNFFEASLYRSKNHWNIRDALLNNYSFSLQIMWDSSVEQTGIDQRCPLARRFGMQMATITPWFPTFFHRARLLSTCENNRTVERHSPTSGQDDKEK